MGLNENGIGDNGRKEMISFTAFFWKIFFGMAAIIGVLISLGYADIKGALSDNNNAIQEMRRIDSSLDRDISNISLEIKHMRELLEIDKTLSDIQSQLKKIK